MVLDNSASWEPSGDLNENINLVPEIARDVPMIKVLGIGGGGSNAVSRMFKEKLPVVEYYALNTRLTARVQPMCRSTVMANPGTQR